MNRIDERRLTRNFLNTIIKESHNDMNSMHYDHENRIDHDYSEDLHDDHSHQPLHSDENGVVSKDELYNHFDLDNDGTVTTQEYADHIDYHAAYPETLDKYREYSDHSSHSVPCQNSYHACGSYYMSDPESMEQVLQPILAATGATCQTSALQSMINVIKAMKECGL
tara:strand:- start:210 stop:710 length:501 start_codon:yes stop_codon:yes gene_type:complete